MKTILLLISSLFLISQNSFGKEINTLTVENKATVENFKADKIASTVSKFTTASAIEKHRLWLNMTNTGGAFKQILLGYMTGATNGWDSMYDGASLDSNPYIDFYSIIPGKNLTIQARAVPFLTTDEIPLGYKAGVEGEFTISIDHLDGLYVSRDVFLKDNTTGLVHNLKTASYTFSTSIGRFNDRFVLVYVDDTPEEELIASEETEPIVTVPEVSTPIVTEPAVTDLIVTVPEIPTPTVTEPEVIDPIVSIPEVPTPTVTEPVVTDPIVNVPEISTPTVTEPVVIDPIVSIPETTVPTLTEPEVIEPMIIVPEVNNPIVDNDITNPKIKKSVLVAVNNNQITINSNEDAISEVVVYSMGSMQLFEKRNINTNEFVISNLNAKKQVLIIKTQLKNGNWTTSKIIL